MNHNAWLVITVGLFVSLGCNNSGGGSDGGGGATDAGLPPPAPGCTTPTGTGTEHSGGIAADETWSAADSPHIVTFDMTVRDATLTIEPCAVVRFREGYSIVVGGTGDAPEAAIVAHGERIANDDGTTTLRPVTFMPDAEGTHWGSLRALATGTLDLEQATLTGGGEHDTAQNGGGTLVAIGAGGPELERNLRTVAVAVEDSEGLGVNLQGYAAFTEDSADLVIRGSGQAPSPTSATTDYPIAIAPPALQSIPSGTYTGNATDAIEVLASLAIATDETFRARGVPYHIDGSFSMAPMATMAEGGLATLTIEAGVTITFEPAEPSRAASFDLGTSNGDAPGNLWPVKVVAAGTASAPIVFTSAAASPSPGDWAGILWHAAPESGNVMSHVRIEYAGGDSATSGFGCGPADNDAALVITHWRPGDAFITDSTIADSLAGGIVSGWTTAEGGPNLKDDNTFSNIGNDCEVSRWASPTPPACPNGVPDCL